ncbi:MAG: glycoside hydrolase family 31 protein [Phycisphaerales bacterium]|nr:glycoside hydrolase family 31 protein [Phycisphaerales bacterium]
MMFGALAADAAGNRPDPKADPKAVVVFDKARFTILTPRLIRVEWSPSGQFEDRASHAFVNRRLAVPAYDKSVGENTLMLKTDRITVRYENDGKPFGKGNFKVSVRVGPGETYWNGAPPFEQRMNLGGTTRTLDGISGASDLEPGLLTRDGWSFIDDSKRLLFDDITSDRPWVAEREEGALDWYLFCYAQDYKQALYDFTQVAGRIPLPPRYVFGAWWSRYWAYSDEELRRLVGEFKEHDVPLDVLVIDMDWHLDGWTGYTWHPEYFPDPEGFLKWVHEQGLRATLNLHPADGVGNHEKAFSEMAEAMGLDPKKVDRIPFDCTDRNYMDAYFKVLHHPLEKMGVDFWWLDWQQGTETKIQGLDPLWWLNHLHWADMQRRAEETGRRPLIFSRWGGLGNHRYQIGFSGDTFCNWPSLAFQPYFTSTAGNVGFAYWSHDIGGHQPGPVEPELYARWIQYGAFSPILRTHTTKNPDAERRIWKFPPDVFEAARKAFHLRYALIPYIYTMARKCYDTGLPLCRPLYYEWPDLEESYRHSDQYMFGDDFLVAPVVEPADPSSGCAMAKVWLPPGHWTNWFTGRAYEGPTYARLLVPLDEIPLFARSGAVIPTMPGMSRSNQSRVDPLILNIFPGKSGHMRVYEDDGVGPGYQKDEYRWLPVTHKFVDGRRQILVGPAEGSFPGELKARDIEIRIFDDLSVVKHVKINDREVRRVDPAVERFKSGWRFDGRNMGPRIKLSDRPANEKTSVVIEYGEQERKARSVVSGLRGFLRTEFYCADLLGLDGKPSAPMNADVLLALRDSSLRKGIAQSPEWKDECLLRSIKTIQKAVLPEASKKRALLRLLGIMQKLRVIAGDESGRRLMAHIEYASTFPSKIFDDMAVEVEVAIDTPEGMTEKKEFQFKGLSERRPFLEDVPLTVNRELNTGIVRCKAMFRRQDLEFALVAEHIFLPSINAWWVVGPFEGGPLDSSLSKVLPPEAKIDLQASYKGKDDRAIRWRQIKRTIKPGDDLTDEFFIDFDDVFGSRVYDAVAYAFTYLDAPEDIGASLAIGSDDGVVVWLNGVEVHRNDIGRPYSSKQDRVPVKLKKGVNTLLLKINQGGGDWGFGVHVETPNGRPLTVVRPKLQPD